MGIVFQNPARQQHHDDALAAALGVPDDAALFGFDVLLGGLDAEILVRAREFLLPDVEQDKIAHQLDDTALFAQFEQVFVQLEAGVVLLVFLPGQEILFPGADRAIFQAFAVVPGKDELDGAEKPGVELRLLVGQVLADAIADADAAVFEFQHADGEAVDIQHQIGAALIPAMQGDFFGEGEVVLFRRIPVDQLDGFGDLPGFGFDRHAVAQQVVDGLVVAVERAVAVVGIGVEFVERGVDLGNGIPTVGQEGAQVIFPDVAVLEIGSVAEIAIAELVAEQGDDAVLGDTFGAADNHKNSSV